jgi:hypothetical protein
MDGTGRLFIGVGASNNVGNSGFQQIHRLSSDRSSSRTRITNMAHGFFTVEQWKAPKAGAKSQWVPVLHLDANQSLTKAIAAIERSGKPGLFRVIQTQRQIWAEIEDGTLRLRRHHVSTHDNLTRVAEAFDRDGGRWPVEKERRERAAAKRKRAQK